MNRPPEAPIAIASIMKVIAEKGIAKSGQNEDEGYSYRTIDDILECLAELLPANHLIVIPNVVGTPEYVERRLSSGAGVTDVRLEVRYDFMSLLDGSVVSAVVPGHSLDQSDKGPAKAMAAAYKVVMNQVFCIVDKSAADPDQKSPMAGTPMDAREAEKHEKAILGAINPAMVKTAHTNATAAAKRAGDEDARKRFNEAKKKRLADLTAAKEKADEVINNSMVGTDTNVR